MTFKRIYLLFLIPIVFFSFHISNKIIGTWKVNIPSNQSKVPILEIDSLTLTKDSLEFDNIIKLEITDTSFKMFREFIEPFLDEYGLENTIFIKETYYDSKIKIEEKELIFLIPHDSLPTLDTIKYKYIINDNQTILKSL
tara:strand:+ start:114 stop:533 length:420 start_codon:yes stop_codon:yes gene_type:complete